MQKIETLKLAMDQKMRQILILEQQIQLIKLKIKKLENDTTKETGE